MKKRTLSSAVFYMTLLASSGIQVQGSLVLSNLEEIYTTAGPVASDLWIAQEFVAGPNPEGYTLNSVQLRMHEENGFAEGFSISIYTKTGAPITSIKPGDIPDQSIGQLVGPNPSAGGTFTYTATDIILEPSRFYYIVATASTPAATGAYAWSATNANDSGNGWVLTATHFNSPNGSDWTWVPRREIYQVAIRVTAIPEPSVLVLAGIGLLILGLSVTRN